MPEVSLTQFIVSMSLFILVQGIGLVKAKKWGDFVYYYIPVTIIASAVFWAALILSPGLI